MSVKIPNGYRCSITTKIMVDPVVALDGSTYEREAIEKWISEKGLISPKTSAPLPASTLIPNMDKKADIEEFLADNPQLYEANEVYLPRGSLANLAKAIRDNAMDQVNTIFTQDARCLMEQVDAQYYPFHLAAETSHAMLQLIITWLKTKSKLDAQIALQHPASWNPLYLNKDLLSAVQQADSEQIQLLVKLGANPNFKNDAQKPLLYLATESSNLALVKTLIQVGASPDSTYAKQQQHDKAAEDDAEAFFGPTPLCVAIGTNQLAIAQFLIASGASVDAVKGYPSPLHYAVLFNRPSMVQFLIEGPCKNSVTAPLHVDDNDTTTIAHLATRLGKDAILKVLLDHQVSMEIRDSQERTLLHVALVSGHKEIAKFLTVKGANIEAKDKQGQIALHYCTIWNHLDLVSFFIERGAIVNAVDANGATSLHWAVQYVRLEIVKLLLKCNANVNALDKDSRTPLHYVALIDLQNSAATTDTPDMITVLMENNADHTVTDVNNKSAPDYAREHKKVQFADLMKLKYKEVKNKRLAQLSDLFAMKDQVKQLQETVATQNVQIEQMKQVIHAMFIELQSLKK